MHFSKYDKNMSFNKTILIITSIGLLNSCADYQVNKSIKARGTKGKCTPITKPGCTGRAKALAKTFKKMAKKRRLIYCTFSKI